MPKLGERSTIFCLTFAEASIAVLILWPSEPTSCFKSIQRLHPLNFLCLDSKNQFFGWWTNHLPVFIGIGEVLSEIQICKWWLTWIKFGILLVKPIWNPYFWCLNPCFWWLDPHVGWLNHVKSKCFTVKSKCFTVKSLFLAVKSIFSMV